VRCTVINRKKGEQMTLMQLSPFAIERMNAAIKRGAHPIYAEMWAAWRTLQDKITGHPQYRYPAPYLLLNLAQFNQHQMGIYNDLMWKNRSAPIPPAATL